MFELPTQGGFSTRKKLLAGAIVVFGVTSPVAAFASSAGNGAALAAVARANSPGATTHPTWGTTATQPENKVANPKHTSSTKASKAPVAAKPPVSAKPPVAKPTSAPPASTTLPANSSALLAKIAQCESGGNYEAQNAQSTASGKYQILDTTWNNYGGYVHAKDAPPPVQDAKAAQLFKDQGSTPWNESKPCWG